MSEAPGVATDGTKSVTHDGEAYVIEWQPGAGRLPTRGGLPQFNCAPWQSAQ